MRKIMNFMKKHFVEVKRGTKITYSESDLRKLDRTYERDIIDNSNRRILSTARKVPWQAHLSQVRDYAYEQILDRHMYTFQHILVVPNPYDIVKQSALLLFNSSKTTKIRYRVIGDTPEADFCGETEYTKRHRVPILGLYFKRSNKVELEMIDEEGEVIKRRQLRIYVSEMPKNLENVVGENICQAEKSSPFLAVNGLAFNPLVVDVNGDIRYSVQLRSSIVGMLPLGEGRFLYEDSTANYIDKRGVIKACRYHVMDYMGRVYHSYLMEVVLNRVIAKCGNSIFFSSHSDEKHVSDILIEMDSRTGEILDIIDMKELVGEKYRDKENWFKLTSLTCVDDYLYFTSKHMHSVIKYHRLKKEIVWILAPLDVWKGTSCEEKVLGISQEDERLLKQIDSLDYVALESSEKKETFLLFAVGDHNDVGDPSDFTHSKIFTVEIESEKKKAQVLRSFDCDKTITYGSAFYSKDKKSILACLGKVDESVEETGGYVVEYDKENGDVVHKVRMKKAFNKVWEFTPDLLDCSKKLEIKHDVMRGKISSPEVYTGVLPEISEENVNRKIIGGVNLCNDLILMSILPGNVEKIYFCGKNHTYVKDYSYMEKKNTKYTFAISMSELAVDEYFILVQIAGIGYRLKNEVRVIA